MTWIIIGIWISGSIVLWFIPHGLKIQGALMVLAIAVFIIEHGANDKRFRINKTVGIFILCYLPLYLSSLWSTNIERTCYELLKITPGVMLCFLISCLIKEIKDIHKVLLIFVLTEIITIGMGLFLVTKYGSLRGVYRGVEELKAISGFVGFYAAVCLPVISFLIGNVKAIFKKSALFIVFVFGFIVCILSGTKAAIIGAIFAFFIISLRKLKLRIIVFNSALIMTFIGLFFFFLQNFKTYNNVLINELNKRFLEFNYTIEPGSDKTRIANWLFAVDILSNNLKGIGYESYSEIYGIAPHNLLLDFGLAAGIIGLLSIFTLIFTTCVGYYKLWRRYDKLNETVLSNIYYAFFSAFVCTVAYSMFWQVLWHPIFYLFLAIGLNYKKCIVQDLICENNQ
jgi:O-antigen ligase